MVRSQRFRLESTVPFEARCVWRCYYVKKAIGTNLIYGDQKKFTVLTKLFIE